MGRADSRGDDKSQRTKALGFDKYNLAGDVVGSTPLSGAFQKAIDDAVIAVSTGTADFNTAMRETVKRLGGSGVKVTYGSGVNRALSGMVRQNLLYGAKQAAQAYDEYVGDQLGCDGFEVDYHAHPRPTHAFMGGEMYSYDGDVTVNGRTYKDGAEALERLGDYGCLHFKTDVILGVSEPRYDAQWLAEQKAKDNTLIEFNGKQKTAYEWQQAQRRIETETRRQRDIAYMANASGDKVLVRQCEDKIIAYRKTYDDLCETVGLEKRYNRMATYYPKSVDKTDGNGIIKTANGLQVKGLTSHARERAAERGVTNSAIETALQKPLVVKEPIIDVYGRKSQRFIGENATVNINPDTGTIITTWKTGKATVKKYKKE